MLTNVLQEATNLKLILINPLIRINSASSAPFKVLCHKGWSSCPFSWGLSNQSKSQYLSHQITSKRWLVGHCRSQDSISPENEYRSSRNIAISLLRRYRNFVERGGGDNLKEFISAGVNAYALGCTELGLRKELTDMKESGVEIEAMQDYGGNMSLKSRIFSQEVEECIMWLSIVFITILCTPQPTVVRWSTTRPVSEDMLIKWKGFCAIIANAYFTRGMAWLPVKTLQLEQMAVMGRAEEPSLVASRMRLVFSTLEVVSPQWPRG
ncbi:bifunctional protein BirA [Striga asiatica]|uniref:Bifunctional protein BirA n=1 Tax=Striga asiatica TaxID=4170 RepID=A0A5A7QIJ4_STRAF|nr:bifunctional protein BirA [Striga asiatica]